MKARDFLYGLGFGGVAVGFAVAVAAALVVAFVAGAVLV